MNALLLLAALSSQITFNTTQQGDVYTIIPEVTLTQSCLCRVQILSLREGSSGQSQTKQEKTLSLPANQPIALTKLSLNISPEDRVKIVVTFLMDRHFIYHNNGRPLQKSLNLLKYRA